MSLLGRHVAKWMPEPNTGCFIWLAGCSGNGRPYVKGVSVARRVCEETYGPPPAPNLDAAHNTPNGCIGGLCVNGSHLRWATRRENQADIPAGRRLDMSRRTSIAKRDLRFKALEAGERFYSTGKPCVNGHIGLRYASGGCKACLRERHQKYRADGKRG